MEGVVQAIANSGWKVDLLSRPTEHPIRLVMSRGRKSIKARIYVWSLTHGGGAARPNHEYRIQVTSGVTRFEVESGEKTIVLGWSAEFGVYAAFDVTRHTKPLGSSPSMQVSKAALLRAGQAGIASHARKNGEIAIAVRPDLLNGYAERLEILHHPSTVEREVETLGRDREPSEHENNISEAELEDFAARLREGRKPRLGDVNERKQRRTILARLEKLEQRAGIVPPQIGHNNPPEDLDPEVAVVRPEDVVASSQKITEQLEKNQPELGEILTETTFLSKVASRLKSTQVAAKSFAKSMKDKAQEKAAELAIGALLAGGGAYSEQVGSAIRAVVESISTWFKMIL
ncbi:hypothetical protein [Roseomonas gilardii]|uniref:hypothetical protein n=1 Tax=Roseomonas gilardii TaxID=257708 RepID=UPI0011AA05DB|nr:hypothetical protein [Roseomonas gilardii]